MKLGMKIIQTIPFVFVEFAICFACYTLKDVKRNIWH